MSSNIVACLPPLTKKSGLAVVPTMVGGMVAGGDLTCPVVGQVRVDVGC